MTKRLHIAIHGAVQGVGFRPFIYRMAREMALPGWVMNSPQGVFIEVEGDPSLLDRFLLRIGKEKPPRSSIHSLEYSELDPVGFSAFEIRASGTAGETSVLILPDIAACPECVKEIFDPANRRYLYPFTNCTNCGPRFSLIEALPYDRPNTSMKRFEMCPECRQEYEDPLDRRFHAQPNACARCGPHVELWDDAGRKLTRESEAIEATARQLDAGQIVAVKGLGGFHLMVDARNDDAVQRLRQRKHRDEKPLALMFPGLKAVRAECEVSDLEERLLQSPESPIVLLRRHAAGLQKSSQFRDPLLNISSGVAPRNPYLGVMLPYTPLHHLLMARLGHPIVATSGNLSDEPICVDEVEALQRLGAIADAFLVHDRPIVRHVDDSVARVLLGREMVLRRARGYAPLPVMVTGGTPPGNDALLAVGAHLKNTIALSSGREQVFISQHIGDLETEQSFRTFQKVIEDFERMYRICPVRIASDLHPDYLSAQHARRQGPPVIEIQHHYAHVVSCMADNGLDGPVLGVSWDGTGYGLDHSIWGGEFLLTNNRSFERIGSFRLFRLPGGSLAVKEPRRTALGLLYELFGESLFDKKDLFPLTSFSNGELSLVHQMMQKGVNCPWTSSVGRLFDAVASIAGIRQKVRFEGQAAMEWEFAANEAAEEDAYPFEILDTVSKESRTEVGSERNQGANHAPAMGQLPDSLASSRTPWRADWAPLVQAILRDLGHSPISSIAAKFHNSLAEIIVEFARRVGEERVILTGGCFQNKYLTERTVLRLAANGFRPYWHQRVPPNDGGISLGQLVAASRLLRKEP